MAICCTNVTSNSPKWCRACSPRGGDGELTIKLPLKLNKAGQIDCSPKLSTKIPQKPIGTGIFFFDDEGRLSRRDPNQMDIEDIEGVRGARTQ